jgi:flagellar operon protein
MSDPFSVQLGRVNGVGEQPAKPASTAKPVLGPSFMETLESVQNVRFSNHAIKRLQSREIDLNSENVNRLSDAIDKAEKRGGKSSLVMVDDLAFIVNIQDRTVVTALDTNQRGEGVFTQIDSVVFADPAASDIKTSIDVKG